MSTFYRPTPLAYGHLILYEAVFSRRTRPSAGERYKKGYGRTHKKRGGRKPGPCAAQEIPIRTALQRGQNKVRSFVLGVEVPALSRVEFQIALLTLCEILYFFHDTHVPPCLVFGQPIHSCVMYWWGRRCSTWAWGRVRCDQLLQIRSLGSDGKIFDTQMKVKFWYILNSPA